MYKKISFPFLGICMLLLWASCVDDTDFDSLEDVALTPEVELNLIYFTINADQFYNPDTSTSILTVSDTTELRFLNEQVDESLKRADFYFKFTNSIPRNFNVDFQFLSEANDTTYVTQTFVEEGTLEAPQVTEFNETVTALEIAQLTQATKVVVSVTIPSSDATLQGSLNLQSKATYYLEY